MNFDNKILDMMASEISRLPKLKPCFDIQVVYYISLHFGDRGGRQIKILS